MDTLPSLLVCEGSEIVEQWMLLKLILKEISAKPDHCSNLEKEQSTEKLLEATQNIKKYR